MILEVLVYGLATVVAVVVLLAAVLFLCVAWIASGDPSVNGDPERDGGVR